MLDDGKHQVSWLFHNLHGVARSQGSSAPLGVSSLSLAVGSIICGYTGRSRSEYSTDEGLRIIALACSSEAFALHYSSGIFVPPSRSPEILAWGTSSKNMCLVCRLVVPFPVPPRIPSILDAAFIRAIDIRCAVQLLLGPLRGLVREHHVCVRELRQDRRRVSRARTWHRRKGHHLHR